MVRTLFRTLILIALLPLAVAARQDSPPAPQAPTPVFKAQSDLVVLDVNVFDGKSDAVPDLPQSAFQVYDAGQPQEITFFSSADVPVAVGLVIDNSSSMLTRRQMVLAGTRAFAESSHPEDEVFTLVFNEHVRYGNPDNVDFTTSPAQVEAGLLRFPAGGMTAMYDAVIEAIDHIDHATLQKRALIVLSDGEDNASRHSEADMLHRTLRSDALVYTISTADFSTRVGKPGVLKKLAERTGGAAYFPQTEKAVVAAFTEVAQNIRRGYRIGYTPSTSTAKGEYRRIKVLVHVRGRNLSVRVRDGYTQDGEADTR
ncbi:MAG TPA: VWA domain-containing protein [Vicinamibacterales bacterium]|jgi:Ca-activated chloride channel family protein|nr:VWA domain-containing protein [Vicinamibacterales bacterium]